MHISIVRSPLYELVYNLLNHTLRAVTQMEFFYSARGVFMVAKIHFELWLYSCTEGNALCGLHVVRAIYMGISEQHYTWVSTESRRDREFRFELSENTT